MIKLFMTLAAISTLLAPAYAAKQDPQESCQSMALGSIAKSWSRVLKGQFEIVMKGGRCLIFLQTNSLIYEGKRTAWLIDGKSGVLLSEFYAPTTGSAWQDDDLGLCTFSGGRFPTSECTWSEYLDQAGRM